MAVYGYKVTAYANNYLKARNSGSHTGASAAMHIVKPGEVTPEDPQAMPNLLVYRQAKTMPPAKSLVEQNNRFRNSIGSTMERLGIVLGEEDTLTVAMDKDASIHISGMANEADAAKLEATINAQSKASYRQAHLLSNDIYTTTFYLNSKQALAAGSFRESRQIAGVMELKQNATNLAEQKIGYPLDFEDLYYDENGQIAGYPEEISWVFENEYEPKTTAEQLVCANAKAIKYIASLLLDDEHTNIPNISNISVIFQYKKKDFLHVDTMI